MREVPHSETLRLIHFGGAHKQVLLHRLTGEHVEVDQQFALEFDEDIAYLGHPGSCDGNSQESDDDASVWANDLLDLSTFVKGAGCGIWVCSKAMGTRTLLSTFRQSVRSLPFCHKCSAGIVKLEIYEHKAPHDMYNTPICSFVFCAMLAACEGNGQPRHNILSVLRASPLGTCAIASKPQPEPRPWVHDQCFVFACCARQAPPELTDLRRFVALPRIQDAIFGAASGSKFICKHFDSWIGVMRSSRTGEGGAW